MNVARVTDVLSLGGNIVQGSPDVLTNSLGTARVTDRAICKEHGPTTILAGSSTTLTNTLGTARVCDQLACGCVIISGSADRFVDDQGGANGPSLTFSQDGQTFVYEERDLGSTNDDPDTASSVAVYPPVIGRKPTSREIERSIKNGVDPASPEPTPSTSDNTPPPINQPTVPGDCSSIAIPLDYRQYLSPNFTLGHVSIGTAISRYQIVAQHGLSQADIACNLMFGCLNLLEPLAARVGRQKIIITSAFRPGSSTSQHERGQAFDIQFTDQGSGNTVSDVMWERLLWCRDNLPFDQLIIEYLGNRPWIHISHNNGKSSSRTKLLSALKHGVYKQGLHRV